MEGDEAEKVAVVTGAGTGIGQAVAIALLKRGYRVGLVGRTLATLEQTAADGGHADAADALAADVGDPLAVDRVFSTVVDKYGRIDLLFNNAGLNVPNVSFEALTFDQWASVISVNLTGAFLCAQSAFIRMKDQKPQGGRIINNGSISAHSPRPASAPYTASKHAVTGLTKSIALDGRPYDIACSQIDIGNARTKMANRMATGVLQADGRIAAEPMMDVAHVADIVSTMAALPLSVNVQFITIMATKMPFVGRG